MKVVLIDDHAVVREGYRALISRQADMEVVAEFADAGIAYAQIKDLAVDVIVTDLSMPGLSAVEMIERLRQRDHAAKFLVFSMHTSVSFAKQAFAAGANAYVTKSSDPNTLLLGLREVFAGRQYLSADIAQQLAMEQLESIWPSVRRNRIRTVTPSSSIRGERPGVDVSPATAPNNTIAVKRVINHAFRLSPKRSLPTLN